MSKPNKITKKEYVKVMKAMGFKDPVGLYNAYDQAVEAEQVEWFDTHLTDSPTGNEMELMFLKTA